jgi:hypothetical protein
LSLFATSITDLPIFPRICHDLDIPEGLHLGGPGTMSFAYDGPTCPYCGSLLKVREGNTPEAQKKRRGPGRPKKNLNVEQARRLREAGKSLREIAQLMGCSKTTIFMRLRGIQQCR